MAVIKIRSPDGTGGKTEIYVVDARGQVMPLEGITRCEITIDRQTGVTAKLTVQAPNLLDVVSQIAVGDVVVAPEKGFYCACKHVFNEHHRDARRSCALCPCNTFTALAPK